MKNENIIIYAIVPSYIYETKELTSEEKLIAERITALCKKEGYCWVTNKTLADMYGIKEDTVSKHIKRLKEIGFIKCLYKNETQNKSKRLIYLTDNVWDKEPTINSINNQNDNGYISGHNNKYNYKNNINKNIVGPVIGIDPDGIETWNGKRIEKQEATDEELKELEDLLKEICGDKNE